MRFSVLQEHLARGLAVVSHAVASRATLPILSNVYLSTEDGGLRLTATNLEIAITHWIPAKVEEKGATTIPARILGDVVSGLLWNRHHTNMIPKWNDHECRTFDDVLRVAKEADEILSAPEPEATW